MKRIWGVECPACKQRIFSKDRHDLRYCYCRSTFVDGGRDYLRYGGGTKDKPPRRIYWSEKQDGLMRFFYTR